MASRRNMDGSSDHIYRYLCHYIYIVFCCMVSNLYYNSQYFVEICLIILVYICFVVVYICHLFYPLFYLSGLCFLYLGVLSIASVYSTHRHTHTHVHTHTRARVLKEGTLTSLSEDGLGIFQELMAHWSEEEFTSINRTPRICWAIRPQLINHITFFFSLGLTSLSSSSSKCTTLFSLSGERQPRTLFRSVCKGQKRLQINCVQYVSRHV